MSKPRRPRNAKSAHKPPVAPPGADATTTATGPGDHPAFNSLSAHEAPVQTADALDPTAIPPIAALAMPDAAPAIAMEIVMTDGPLPEALPESVGDHPAPAPSRPDIAATPHSVGHFGTTVMNYVIGEGEAFAAHMRALAGARSMADFVRLQIGEFQRAADATLTCWGILALSASRAASPR